MTDKNRKAKNIITADKRFSVSRREFLRNTLLASALLAVPDSILSSDKRFRAGYSESMEGSLVRCLLCPKKCVIPEGKTGFCGVRKNTGGVLYSLSYGHPCSVHADPIEKKPFFHVLPGSYSLSISTVGCNFECKFCQNWQISQSTPEMVHTSYTPPEKIVSKAVSNNLPSVTYTYGEPVVFIEYAQDISRLASEHGLKSFVVTNGYYNSTPFRDLCGVIDAVKIDLKGFTDSYYRKICAGTLRPVLDSIVQARKSGIWLEIVYLMIPTLNDSPDEIRRMARWLVKNAGEDVPIHFSRFFPQYKLKNLPPTPVSSLQTAYDICSEEGMKFVYIGNVPGHRAENSYCPSCGEMIMERQGYRIKSVNMKGASCAYCGERIPGIWDKG